MAMSKQILGAAMKSKMDELTDEEKADRSKTFEALADAIIDHIKTYASVAVPAAGLIETTPGGPAPVTGAATGTIT
jgi:hypothetical protein